MVVYCHSEQKFLIVANRSNRGYDLLPRVQNELLLIFLSLTSVALRRNIMNQQEYDNLSISFISSLPSDIKLGQMNSDSKAANLHSIIG